MFSFLNKKNLILFLLISSVLLLKIYLNSFLLAENGDTYDFFRIAYEYRNDNFLIDSKRMPLFPLILSLFNEDTFVYIGRLLNNLFYVFSLFLVFQIIKEIFKLDFKKNLIYTFLFGVFYPILDNSFFIMSDTLFLLLSLCFIYSYLKQNNLLVVTFIGFFAFYTRFEGILLILALVITLLLQNKFKEIVYVGIFSVFLISPFLYKNFLVYGGSFKLGYLEDSSGFILNFKNILKAFGTLAFLTGGFWFLPIFLSRIKDLKKVNLKPMLIIIFILFVSLLVSWGFYIRLYSIPLFISYLGFIYLLENYQKPSRIFYFYTLLSFGIWFYIAHILDHVDLAETKVSKIIAVVISFLILILFMNLEKIKFSKFFIILLIGILNISLFTTKFIETREKYFTLVQAGKFSLENFPNQVGYADESGVLKWYLKDFAQKKNYLFSNEDFGNWVVSEKIKYFVYTEEMGFQDKKIKPYLEQVKNSEKIAEFKSKFSGGKTLIYKLK